MNRERPWPEVPSPSRGSVRRPVSSSTRTRSAHSTRVPMFRRLRPEGDDPPLDQALHRPERLEFPHRCVPDGLPEAARRQQPHQQIRLRWRQTDLFAEQAIILHVTRPRQRGADEAQPAPDVPDSRCSLRASICSRRPCAEGPQVASGARCAPHRSPASLGSRPRRLPSAGCHPALWASDLGGCNRSRWRGYGQQRGGQMGLLAGAPAARKRREQGRRLRVARERGLRTLIGCIHFRVALDSMPHGA